MDHAAELRLSDWKNVIREQEPNLIGQETNLPVHGPFLSLGTIKQKAGKIIHAWAVEGRPDLGLFKSNTFDLEWPPKSGQTQSFPEVDRVQFFLIGGSSSQTESRPDRVA
jgi:predicted NUDIX family NTP pyrophosphohydrolase